MYISSTYNLSLTSRALLTVKRVAAGKLVVSRDGGRWCADVLDCLVRSGQPLAAGHAETRRYAAASSGQRHAVLHVYSAEPRAPLDADMPQVNFVIIQQGIYHT